LKRRGIINPSISIFALCIDGVDCK
jgi:hypothetical protein